MFYVSYRDDLEVPGFILCNSQKLISGARSILLIIVKVLHCQDQLALYPQLKKLETPSELQPLFLKAITKNVLVPTTMLHPRKHQFPQSTGQRLYETTWIFCTMLKPNVRGVDGGWVSCVPWHVEVVTVGEAFGEFLVHPCFTYHLSSSPPIISSTIHQPHFILTILPSI